MLAEALFYCITPSSRAARRSGQLTAAISLWSRARRCAAAWAPHESHCRAAVAQAIEGLSRRRTVLVLGSGLMRDVDLDALRAAFAKVILADVVHLWPIRLRTLLDRRVRLVAVDLTNASALGSWQADPEIDLVISANVLSQLPLFSKPGAVRKHLDDLARFPCRVCLLTDTERLRRSRSGEVGERSDLLEGAVLPPAPLCWDWTVAPFGEDGADGEWIHHAQAHPDFRI